MVDDNAGGSKSGRPYLVISSDSHAGPSLENSLRPYCPAQHLEAFDDFVRALRSGEVTTGARDAEISHVDQIINQALNAGQKSKDTAAFKATVRASNVAGADRHKTCPGHDDPKARLDDMDEGGVTAELIFAGGQNSETMPFIGFASDAGPKSVPVELRRAGEDIWNHWLADFCSVAPERLLGVMQIPIWDIDESIKVMRWGKEAGLAAVNFPAPRSDFPAYNDPIYEPLWNTAEELELPLVTHSGGGEQPLGMDGPGAFQLYIYENLWLTRRHLWQMIFGGVLERHPKLTLTLTEQRVWWVGQTLRELDNIYLGGRYRNPAAALPRKPSEYWATNCFNSGSYMAPFEAMLYEEVGPHNLQWGTDYPHVEGTWPYTKLSMRNTFAGVPEQFARLILGENAIRAYHLDESVLRPIADRIGPRPEDMTALGHDEYPADGGNVFREFFEIVEPGATRSTTTRGAADHDDR